MIKFRLKTLSADSYTICTLVRTAERQGQAIKYISPADDNWSDAAVVLRTMLSTDKSLGGIEIRDEILFSEPVVIYGGAENQFRSTLTATGDGVFIVMSYLNVTKAKFEIRKIGYRSALRGQFV